MPLRLAIGILSGAAIAYQLLLIRLLSIVQWHHFTYMVISLALLGYGASGAFLTFVRRPLLRRFEAAFAACAALFGLLAPGSFALAQRLRLNPLEIMWDPRQFPVIAGVYLLLALPFFVAGSAVGLALARFEDQVHRIYRADLTGAAVGAMAAVGGLYLWLPATGLRMVGAAGGLAAFLVWAFERRERRRGWRQAITALLAALALVVPVAWPAGWLEPRMSEYKALKKALRVPGVEVIAERSSPLGALAAVASPRVPFRLAPGLSFQFSGEIPEQILIFRDGEVEAVVDQADAGRAGRDASLSYLRHLPIALPFELASQRGSDRELGGEIPGEIPSEFRVAVLGAGSGLGLNLALLYGADKIHAVEADRRLVKLWSDDLADFAGRPLEDPRIRRHLGDPRGFLNASRERYDLILLPAAGNDVAAGTAASLRESYAHTVEALSLALARSSRRGIVVLEGEATAPPRASLKLVATAVEALERAGLEPRRHLVAIRSWNRWVVLFGRSEFETSDLVALRRFCDERAFDVAYYPGMRESEANRFHLLDQPELFRGIESLLGPSRARFVADYKFDIRPATDDRPYFLHFFRWGTLGELLRLRTSGGAALLEWGYVFLVVTLAHATLAGLVLIVLPLWWLKRRAPATGAGRVGLYFLCLGLGFIFLEIAFIQRLTLLLAHPLLAAGVVLAGFLLFAGLGSGVSHRLQERRPRTGIQLALAAIVLLALAELALLRGLFALGSGWPLGLRLPTALAAIMPLAFLLGMPFPLGLRRVAASAPDLVPWAWGVNGWASVLAAVLATLLAVHFGFTAVVLIACGLYLVAAVAAPQP